MGALVLCLALAGQTSAEQPQLFVNSDWNTVYEDLIAISTRNGRIRTVLRKMDNGAEFSTRSICHRFGTRVVM